MTTFVQYLIEKAAADAFAKEVSAFKAIKKKTGLEAFQAPAGADQGFPDFGFELWTEDGYCIDLHIEYKKDRTAQMGSMRDWHYTDGAFATPTNDPQKIEMIDIINDTPQAHANAKRILSEFQRYVDPNIDAIYSGMLNHIKDKKERWEKLNTYKEHSSGFAIANIDDERMGDRILKHYKKKFKRVVRAQSDASICLMLIKDQMWWVDKQGQITPDEMSLIAETFGVPSIPKMSGLKAKLEVRIQPRGLSNPGGRASVDVMASFRLSGAPANGAKVI